MGQSLDVLRRKETLNSFPSIHQNHHHRCFLSGQSSPRTMTDLSIDSPINYMFLFVRIWTAPVSSAIPPVVTSSARAICSQSLCLSHSMRWSWWWSLSLGYYTLLLLLYFYLVNCLSSQGGGEEWQSSNGAERNHRTRKEIGNRNWLVASSLPSLSIGTTTITTTRRRSRSSSTVLLLQISIRCNWNCREPPQTTLSRVLCSSSSCSLLGTCFPSNFTSHPCQHVWIWVTGTGKHPSIPLSITLPLLPHLHLHPSSVSCPE